MSLKMRQAKKCCNLLRWLEGVFQGLPKFDHKLRRHLQRFGKIITTAVACVAGEISRQATQATTAVLNKDENFVMIRDTRTSESSLQRNDAIICFLSLIHI